MGRYANNGYQELYDSETNELKGINFGYGFYAEHEYGYLGEEIGQEDDEKANQKSAFENEKIKDPSKVFFIKTIDGKAMLTNNDWFYHSLAAKDPVTQALEIDKYLQHNNGDKERDISYKEIWNQMFHMDMEMPPYDTQWNKYQFTIVGLDEFHNALLKRLYQEIQAGNVAVSADFSSLFDDRGLSFVFLDKLTKEDYFSKKNKDFYEQSLKQKEKEMRQYLWDEEMDTSKYPIKLFNVQIDSIEYNPNGEQVAHFYLAVYDNRKQFKKDGEGWLINIPRKMTEQEIYCLVEIIRSDELNLVAQTYTSIELEDYIMQKLELYQRTFLTSYKENYKR